MAAKLLPLRFPDPRKGTRIVDRLGRLRGCRPQQRYFLCSFSKKEA